MMQIPERIFHLADIEPKKFDVITYFKKYPGKGLLYDIPTKLKTKDMILQVLNKEPSNLDCETLMADRILKPKLTPQRLLDYELCLLACEKEGGNLTHVPDRLIDYEICKAAVHSRPVILWKVPDRFIDFDLLKATVTCPTDWFGQGLDAVLKDERHDKSWDQKLASLAVEINPLALSIFPYEWKTKDIVHRAVSLTRSYKKDKAYLLSEFTRVTSEGTLSNSFTENKLPPEQDVLFVNKTPLSTWPLEYVPREFINDELVQLSLDVCPRSIGALFSGIGEIPKKYTSTKFLTKELLEKIVVTDPLSYEFLPDRIKKSNRELQHFMPSQDEKPKTFVSHLIGKSSSRKNKQEAAADTIILVNSQPAKTNYPITENGLLAMNSKEIEKHNITKKPVKRGSVCYISDIHIENQLDLVGKTAAEVEEVLRLRICKLSKTIDETAELIVFAGDISSSLELTKRFLRLFAAWRPVLFIPGNHELFIPPNHEHSAVDSKAEQSAALDVFKNEVKKDAVVLQNEIFVCHKRKKNFVVSESAILESTVDELKHILDECSTIVLGGTGYTGNNPDSPGCFVAESDERESSMRFRAVYDKVLDAAGDKTVIVVTHMPIWDWSDYPYHKGWIYISGHTHKNQLLMEDGIAVLADNQVGYEKKPWRFKSFSIDVAWDPVSKLPDGIHEISHDAYDAFNRNREIQATLNREGQCYCLKRGNLFMFAIEMDGKKYLLDGGKIRSLDCMLSYYYDNMVEYARRVKRLFKPFHAVLEEISSIVQSYGGNGRIHGSIVDVDLLHHICLDPAGTVSFYYAEKKGDWKRFDSFEDLLKSKNLYFVPRCLDDSTENALAAVSNETKALMLSSSEMNSAAAKTTRESYARSATISKVNYLTKNNVIRIWNDAVMRNQSLLFIDANKPIGTHLSQGRRNLPA